MGRKQIVYPPDRGAMRMDNREMMHYVSHVRILCRMTAFGRKEYIGYSVSGVDYSEDMTRFLLCACYIGLAATYVQGKERVNISQKKIWQLSSFIDRKDELIKYRLVTRHKMILAEAFKILGCKAELDIEENHLVIVKKVSEVKADDAKEDGVTLWFDLQGEAQDLFSFRLYVSTELGYS